MVFRSCSRRGVWHGRYQCSSQFSGRVAASSREWYIYAAVAQGRKDRVAMRTHGEGSCFTAAGCWWVRAQCRELRRHAVSGSQWVTRWTQALAYQRGGSLGARSLTKVTHPVNASWLTKGVGHWVRARLPKSPVNASWLTKVEHLLLVVGRVGNGDCLALRDLNDVCRAKLLLPAVEGPASHCNLDVARHDTRSFETN